MRCLFFIFIYLCSFDCAAQIERFWTDDTANVRKSYYDGDTVYQWKKYRANAECYIYYDVEFRHKASYHLYGPNNYDVDSAWFRNGTMRSWAIRCDKCTGCWTKYRWYPNGQIKFKEECINDTCIGVRYYESGRIFGIDKHWQDTGDFPQNPGWHFNIEYYENGQKKYDPVNPRKSGEQSIIEYYDSGAKKSVWTMLNYINKIGLYREWYENGQLKCTGEYADLGRKMNGISATDREGIWHYYDENGNLTKEELYKNGNLIKTTQR